MFRKKNREPRVHAPAQRLIFVPAPLAETSAQLAAHADIVSPQVAVPQPMQVAHHAGWTVVVTQAAIHPWAFHNLAHWLLDTPSPSGGAPAGRGLIVRAEPASIPVPSLGLSVGYTLGLDSELDSCLSGWFDNGTPLSVYVPTNDQNTTDPAPVTVVAPMAVQEALALLGRVPPTPVLLEDPGHDLNPDNGPTAESRQVLVPAPWVF